MPNNILMQKVIQIAEGQAETHTKLDTGFDNLNKRIEQIESSIKTCTECIACQEVDTAEVKESAKNAHVRIGTIWSVVIPIIIVVLGAIGAVWLEFLHHVGGK